MKRRKRERGGVVGIMERQKQEKRRVWKLESRKIETERLVVGGTGAKTEAKLSLVIAY